MNFRIILFAISFLCSTYASANISQKDCPSIDNSKHFGPTRDQDGNGYCWAFTASALAEEYFCKKNPSQCGKSISPLDISRCDWGLNSDDEGSEPEEALKCAIKGGVCAEVHAPFNAAMTLSCSVLPSTIIKSIIQPANLADNLSNPHCEREKIKTLYLNWKKQLKVCTEDRIINSIEVQKLKETQEDLIEHLRETMPKGLQTDKNLRAIIHRSKSVDEFLKLALIGPKCSENRHKIVASVFDSSDFYKSQLNFPKIIKDALSKKTSIALTLNLGLTKQAKGFVGKMLYSDGDYHALVLNGMRYNSKTKTCEIKLKNSWGVGAPFHGWYPYSDIEEAIARVSYLK